MRRDVVRTFLGGVVFVVAGVAAFGAVVAFLSGYRVAAVSVGAVLIALLVLGRR